MDAKEFTEANEKDRRGPKAYLKEVRPELIGNLTKTCTTSAKKRKAKMNDLLILIERLRNEWADQAWGIERTHGDNDAGGKAIRGCIGDLGRIVEEYKKDGNEGTVKEFKEEMI